MKFSIATSAIALLSITDGLAQSVTPQSSSSSEQQVADEIVVLGLRQKAAEGVSVGILGNREILDVPFSIQGYGRELLDQRISRGLRDILDNDPSVQFETTAGSYGDTLIIRGYPVSNFYFDGFTGPASVQPTLNLDIIDRVEVLRGPSSLVFGGADPNGGVGGAVNYIPKRAPEEGTIQTLSVGVEGQSAVFVTGDVGGRFGAKEQFGYRFVASSQNGELVAKNNEIQSLSLLASFDWRATETLRLSLDLVHFDEVNNGYQDVTSIPTFDLPEAPDPSRNFANEWTRYESNRDFGILKAAWDFAPDWTATVGVSYSQTGFPYFGGALVNLIEPAPGEEYNGEASFAPFEASESDIDTISANARVAGQFQTGGITHDLTVGLRYDDITNEGAGFSLAFDPPLPPGPNKNIYNPIRLPEPVRVGDKIDFGTQETNSLVAQATDFVELTPWLTVLAGVGFVNLDQPTAGYEESRVSPIGGVTVAPADNLSVYASYAEALEVGGFAPLDPLFTNAGEQFEPIVSEQYEIGAKYQFRRMNLTAAYFNIDRAFTFTVDNGDGTFTFVQDGRQVHKGFEFAAFGDITDDLYVIGSFNIINPSFERAGDPDVAGNGVFGTIPIIEGNEPAGVSDFAARLFASYEFSQTIPGLTLTGGLRHKSSQFLTPSNLQQTPDWTVFDLGASYDLSAVSDADAVFRIQVDNVTDRRYWNGVSFGGFGLSVGDARTLRASLTIGF